MDYLAAQSIQTLQFQKLYRIKISSILLQMGQIPDNVSTFRAPFKNRRQHRQNPICKANKRGLDSRVPSPLQLLVVHRGCLGRV